VAPLGTAFTVDQAKLLKRFAPSVVFLFDADAAGQKAVRASREPAREAGLTAKVASLPDKKDPDDIAREKGVDEVRAILSRAKGMTEFLFDAELDATFGSADAHERVARVAAVAKLLVEDDDPLVRSMHKAYVDQLASRLDIVRSPDAFRALERAVKHALATAPPPKATKLLGRSNGDEFTGDRERAAAAMIIHESNDEDGDHPERMRVKARPPGSRERAEIVGAVIEFPSLLDDAEVQTELANLEGPSARTIVAIASASKDDGRGGKTFDIDAFLSQVPPAIQSFASERIAAPHHETIEDARHMLFENGKRLRGHMLAREVGAMTRDLHQAAGDWDVELELAREAHDRLGVKPKKT
jgi:DNA primase